MKAIRLSLLAITVSAKLPELNDPNADGWVKNVDSGSWGWCPQPPITDKGKYPTWAKSGYVYPLLQKLHDDKIPECSDVVMETAGEKFGPEDGEDKNGQYKQYPGGTCSLIQEWVDDEGEPECESGGAINFLHVHYCTMEQSFCSTGQDIVMLPLAVSFFRFSFFRRRLILLMHNFSMILVYSPWYWYVQFGNNRRRLSISSSRGNFR